MKSNLETEVEAQLSQIVATRYPYINEEDINKAADATLSLFDQSSGGIFTTTRKLNDNWNTLRENIKEEDITKVEHMFEMVMRQNTQLGLPNIEDPEDVQSKISQIMVLAENDNNCGAIIEQHREEFREIVESTLNLGSLLMNLSSRLNNINPAEIADRPELRVVESLQTQVDQHEGR